MILPLFFSLEIFTLITSNKAEVARLIFAVAGQEYEDFRFERDDWPNHKPNMPFGQGIYIF